MYINGSAAYLAEFFLATQYFQQRLSGMVCFNSVLYCLRVASLNGFYNSDTFPNNDEATRILLSGARPAYQYTGVARDCVVGIFRKVTDRSPFTLSHVMIALDSRGACVGSNNGAIGGVPNWGRVDISRQLTWRQQQNPFYNDPGQPNAPDWAKERVVLSKPIAELLRSAN